MKKIWKDKVCIFCLLWGVIVAAKSVAGQELKPEPEKFKMQEWQGIKNGVRMRLRVPEKSVVGQPLLLEIFVLNESKRTVHYTVTNESGEWGVRVQDEKGQAVPFTSYGYSQFGGDPLSYSRRFSRELPPGSSINATFDLAQLFDLSIGGSYQVTAGRGFRFNPRLALVDPNEMFAIRSEPLRFEVVEPAPAAVQAIKPEIDKANKQELQATRRGVQFTVRLPEENLKGDAVPLELTLLNQSDQDVTYDEMNGYYEWEIALKNWSMPSVPLTRWGQLRLGRDSVERKMRTPKILAPGASVSTVLDLARLYDLTILGTEETYTLILRPTLRIPIELRTARSPEKLVTFETPLNFKIIEPLVEQP